MEFQVTVTPDNGQRAGWEIHYFEVVGIDVDTDRFVQIPFYDNGDGTFASDPIDLDPRRYSFSCDVVGTGRKIEIDVSPHPRIVQAAGDEWPLTAEVPPLQQRDLVVIIFDAGDVQ